MPISTVALAALATFPLVYAHGYVAEIFANNQTYIGSNPNWFYQPTGSVVPTAGWFAMNQDNGYVAPDAYQSNNITCHKNAKPGNMEIPVKAGDKLQVQWNTWPNTHKGPVQDYLALCTSGNCTTADSSELEFFKIDAAGMHNDTSPPGSWASDDLIANNFTWTVQIPANIQPGAYVLRHEIIALHAANQVDGAQNYPQCINLFVSSQGTTDPCTAGANCTKGVGLYNEMDPGIYVDIYMPLNNYTIPGPAVWSGFASAAKRKLRRFLA